VHFVGTYLFLNGVLLGVSFYEVWIHPEAWGNWKNALLAEHSNPWMVFGIALILFPKLALGLSGFETGVAVMTRGYRPPSDREDSQYPEAPADGSPHHELCIDGQQHRHHAVDSPTGLRRGR
jgi:hypothetical protein